MKYGFIIFYLISVGVYAFFSLTKTMQELKLNPSTDSYANELGFQILVFILTQGLFLFLGFLLVIYIFWVNKKEKAKKSPQ